MGDELEQRLFALPFNDVVDIRGLQRLCGQKRRMPSAQDDGKIRIPFFNGTSDFDCLPDHWTGHKRDTKAEGIAHFFEHALFIIWSDGGIDQAYLISGPKQRCRNSQNAQGRSRIRTCEGWEKEYDLA